MLSKKIPRNITPGHPWNGSIQFLFKLLWILFIHPPLFVSFVDRYFVFIACIWIVQWDFSQNFLWNGSKFLKSIWFLPNRFSFLPNRFKYLFSYLNFEPIQIVNLTDSNNNWTGSNLNCATQVQPLKNHTVHSQRHQFINFYFIFLTLRQALR